MSVVEALKKGSSKDRVVMQLLCSLWFYVAHYDINLTCVHIMGVANTTADYLSRNNMSSFFSRHPPTHPSATTPTSNFFSQQPKLDLTTLQEALQSYYHQGLAASTHRTYSVGTQNYLSFCKQMHSPPLPTSEQTLLLYITHLGQLNLAHKTIKVYLSAVRNLHLTSGHFKVFESQLSPRLERVLKGIKSSQAKTNPSRIRLPFTSSIMYKIRSVLANSPCDYNNIMLWTACCRAFFGFLRCSEFTVPTQDTFDNTTYLSYRGQLT